MQHVESAQFWYFLLILKSFVFYFQANPPVMYSYILGEALILISYKISTIFWLIQIFLHWPLMIY